MGIILTSDLSKCPELNNIEEVTPKSIRGYVGRTDIDALICSRDVAQVCQHLDIPSLKMVQLFSAGFDDIDPTLFASKGIHLCNAANVYNVGMAEFVVYAMLMKAKRYHRSIKNRWLRPFRNYHYISELAGKTVGILGAGNIGSEIAHRLDSFNMIILGYDVTDSPRTYFSQIYTQNHLADFLPQCDYIVNCMPLTHNTIEILNNDWFSLMKRDVTVINVGRKQLINNVDFLQFLRAHKDATAILDMFEKIPNPITNPYRRLSNVLVLPGITAISQEIDIKLKALIQDNIGRLYNNTELLNRIV